MNMVEHPPASPPPLGAEWRVSSRDLRTRKDPSLKVPTLTPYYVHVIQDHMKKKRPQPQGTYAHALARTRHTSPKGGGGLPEGFRPYSWVRLQEETAQSESLWLGQLWGVARV